MAGKIVIVFIFTGGSPIGYLFIYIKSFKEDYPYVYENAAMAFYLLVFSCLATVALSIFSCAPK